VANSGPASGGLNLTRANPCANVVTKKVYGRSDTEMRLRLRKLREDDPILRVVGFLFAALFVTIIVVLLWWRLHQ
jgi:hypothetical protein